MGVDYIPGRGKTGRVNRPRGSKPRHVIDPNHQNALPRRRMGDLGIALLHRQIKPGQIVPFTIIAAWGNCSFQAIEKCEHRALRKLRERIRQKLGMTWEQFINHQGQP
jgi:hypothetical protein